MFKTKGNIYLIPNTMGAYNQEIVIPAQVLALTEAIKTYVVENIRTTRRYLKSVNKDIDIDSICFFELTKHTSAIELESFLTNHKNEDIGIMSEAGVPAVADPGSAIVAWAHKNIKRVIPLVGPSSILLALMASGFNGQSFAFNGYLPRKPAERISKLKFFEKRSKLENQTQIFIETPYRNQALLQDILKTCSDSTKLCIALNITLDQEYISTKTIKSWRKQGIIIDKQQAIFIIQASL